MSNSKDDYKLYFSIVLYGIFPIGGFIWGLYLNALNEAFWIFDKDSIVFAPFVLCILGFGASVLVSYAFKYIKKIFTITKNSSFSFDNPAEKFLPASA